MCLFALVVLILPLSVLVPDALILMLSLLVVLAVPFLEGGLSRRPAMQHADRDQRHPNRPCAAAMLHGTAQLELLYTLQLQCDLARWRVVSPTASLAPAPVA